MKLDLFNIGMKGRFACIQTIPTMGKEGVVLDNWVYKQGNPIPSLYLFSSTPLPHADADAIA